jgi:type II secretory pathway pseudopilin PulG
MNLRPKAPSHGGRQAPMQLGWARAGDTPGPGGHGRTGWTTIQPLTTACGRGFLLAEMIVGISLLGLIIAGLAVSMNGFSMINDYQWGRQRCTAAAEAQLDSLAATGKRIETQEMQRLWPGVTVALERTAGAGPWEGLELVQVTATAQPGPHGVIVRLARYVEAASVPVAAGHTESAPDGTARAAKGGRS